MGAFLLERSGGWSDVEVELVASEDGVGALDHHPPGHPLRSFGSAKELTTAIGAFLDTWNQHPKPFAWVNDADQIRAKIDRHRVTRSQGHATSLSVHVSPLWRHRQKGCPTGSV